MVRTAFTVALLLGPLSTSARASADLEGCFLAGINSQRAATGAASLVATGTLTAYGRAHSEAMAAAGDIYHSAQGALGPYLPAGWESWGENVGMASDSATCQPLLDAFLASPNHRANLLNPAFDLAGIGVFVDSGGAMWTTHVFVAIGAPTTTTTTTTPTTTTTTTTTVPSTTSTMTTPTTTTLAAGSTTSTVPTTALPPLTTLPIASLTENEPTTTAAATTPDIPSPDQGSPATTSAGALPTPASGSGDGRATASASGVTPAGNSTMAATTTTPKSSGCRGGSCLGFVLTTVGFAGLAVGAMARWAVRR